MILVAGLWAPGDVSVMCSVSVLWLLFHVLYCMLSMLCSVSVMWVRSDSVFIFSVVSYLCVVYFSVVVRFLSCGVLAMCCLFMLWLCFKCSVSVLCISVLWSDSSPSGCRICRGITQIICPPTSYLWCPIPSYHLHFSPVTFTFTFWFDVYDMNFVQSLHRIWFWFCLLFRSQQGDREISQAIQSELMFSFTTELQPGWLGAV